MRLLVLFTPAWIRDLAGAWIFYTFLPGLPWPKPQFNRIARFAPLVGVFIGAIQAACWLLLTSTGWPKEALAALSIGLNILITGGIHLDGLMDTADGFAAGPSKCISAMKDSRVGAIGVQALIVIILIQIAALLKLNSVAPIAFPIAYFWGRCAPLWAIWKFSYLNKKEKKSIHQIHWSGWKELKPALLILLIVFLSLQFTPLNNLSSVNLKLGIALGVVPAFIVPHAMGLYLKGHNGDSYGASLVIVETINLCLLAVLL